MRVTTPRKTLTSRDATSTNQSSSSQWAFFQRDMRRFVMAIKCHQGTRLIRRIIWSYFRWTRVTCPGLSNFIVALIVTLFVRFVSRELIFSMLWTFLSLWFEPCSWVLSFCVTAPADYLNLSVNKKVVLTDLLDSPFFNKISPILITLTLNSDKTNFFFKEMDEVSYYSDDDESVCVGLTFTPAVTNKRRNPTLSFGLKKNLSSDFWISLNRNCQIDSSVFSLENFM
jgi:hypothetical protein